MTGPTEKRNGFRIKLQRGAGGEPGEVRRLFADGTIDLVDYAAWLCYCSKRE